jgi:hypothetical protein
VAKVPYGSLIRRAGGPNILGTAGCLVQWPDEADRVLLLTAARVLVGRTPELFEAVEAVDLPGKPIGCLCAWSDLNGPTTADVALVHVDPALVDARIGPSDAPKGTNLDPKPGDKLRIFANGKTHNLTITGFGDQTTIDRVTPDSRGSVNYLNQIICDPATEDSCVGAMAMDSNNNIVGMVAGGDGRTFTLVTPIDALLSCTFGNLRVGGSTLRICTSVPATAKAPEKVTHPDHISGALRSFTVAPGTDYSKTPTGDLSLIRGLYAAARHNGFSDPGARHLVAEINRENSFNPDLIWGTHIDPANQATNGGIISWQGSRRTNLMHYLTQQLGAVDNQGRMIRSQANLNAQFGFVAQEMRQNQPAAYQYFTGPGVSVDKLQAIRYMGGRGSYIGWALDNPRYHEAGLKNIDSGYDLVNKAVPITMV